MIHTKRDENTPAILTTDKRALEIYKSQRDASMSRANNINTIQADIEEIKSLIQQILFEVKQCQQ